MTDGTKEKNQRTFQQKTTIRHPESDDLSPSFHCDTDDSEFVNIRCKSGVDNGFSLEKDCHDDSLALDEIEESNQYEGEDSLVDKNVDAKEFVVRVSQSLHRKISRQAHDEGLTTEEFAAELLAEGVVVRAWEIAERKNQMRGGANTPPPPGRSNNNNSNNGSNQYGRTQNNRKPHHRGGMSHTRYQSIMDDKATFLEYVRQQERNRR